MNDPEPGEPRPTTTDASASSAPPHPDPREGRARLEELERQNQELRREKAERDALRARHADLYELAPVGYCTLDDQGLVLEANRAAAALLGVPRDRLVGQPLSAFIFPDDRELCALHNCRLLQTGQIQECELRLAKADGSVLWTQLTAAAARDPDGTPTCHVVLNDISERKRADLAVRVSEKKYRLFFESAADAIFIHDESGRILAANPTACEQLGYELAEVLTLNAAQVDSPEEAPRVPERIAALLRQGHLEFETVHRRKDGSLFPVEVKARLVTWNGRPAAMSICRDITERKQADRFLRLVLENIPDYVFWKDRNSVFLGCNNAIAKAAGLDSPDQIIGKTDYDLGWKKEESDFYVAVDRRVMENDRAETHIIEPQLQAGGKQAWLDTCKVPLHDENGKVIGILGTFMDITERREAEEAMRRHRSYLSAIVENQPGLLWLKDADGRFLAVNGQFAKSCGLDDPALLVGKSDADIWSPELAAKYRADDARVMESKKPLTVEEPISDKGEIKWFETFKTPILDKDGKVIGTTGYSRDITARKRTEEQLRLHAQLLDGVRESVVASDLEGRILYWGGGAERAYGYTAAEVLNRPYRDFAGPVDPPDEHSFRKELLANGAWRGEHRHRRRNGEIFWVSSFISLVLDDRGRPAGFIGIDQDITARKQAEQEKAKLEADLQQARKMESIGRLAGGVAHDFNNMLTVILGNAELALDRPDLPPPVHADLTEIHKAAERSANLTRQLLAFARKQTIRPQILDLNETVAGMLQMLHRLIGENISIDWRPAAEPVPVKVDPAQIDQILANLCVNARDAIAGIGAITIETATASFDQRAAAGLEGAAPGDYVVLSVRDTGCGMDEDTLSHLFEPFFTSKGFGKGTGLGLATIYGIVSQNHGFILADSRPGAGATFKIHLPRHADAEAPLRPAFPEPADARGEATILLVEDEETILNLTARMLEQHGYRVRTAKSPEEALRLAKTHAGPIQLLITDVVMPEMNGRDLSRTLRPLHPELRCLFMSGYPDDVIARHGLLEPGVVFLQKPFAKQALVAKIREALESGRPAHD